MSVAFSGNCPNYTSTATQWNGAKDKRPIEKFTADFAAAASRKAQYNSVCFRHSDLCTEQISPASSESRTAARNNHGFQAPGREKLQEGSGYQDSELGDNRFLYGIGRTDSIVTCMWREPTLAFNATVKKVASGSLPTMTRTEVGRIPHSCISKFRNLTIYVISTYRTVPAIASVCRV